MKRLKAVKAAARELRVLQSERKNSVLIAAARLLKDRENEVLAANTRDLEALSSKAKAKDKDRSKSKSNSQGKNKSQSKNQKKNHYDSAFIDRLALNPARISQMQESLKEVAELTDPLGEIVEERRLGNGLKIQRVRSPLGVIFMIFESRPNVAIEAFSLAFKAGNSLILRGGKESMQTTRVLYSILQDALRSEKISADCLWGIESADRQIPLDLLQQKDMIDVVVPRGGKGLIDFVVKNSKIPIIKNDRGLCHIYVHADADLTQAVEIVKNAKTQRPGVCNSMETLLVHQSVADDFLPQLYEMISKQGDSFESFVRWFGCQESCRILKNRFGVKRARKENWNTEYLDYVMNCRVVDSIETAIEHIDTYSSKHSEAILTRSPEVAQRFQSEVDSAAVYWNASTRFTDGFELGLGGELGISTQKLHVRGPVGLRELTSVKWVICGDGQIR